MNLSQKGQITMKKTITCNEPKKYITYEEPYANQIFTESEMHDIYNTDVNKSEYPDFIDWLHDMLKLGVFETI